MAFKSSYYVCRKVYNRSGQYSSLAIAGNGLPYFTLDKAKKIAKKEISYRGVSGKDYMVIYRTIREQGVSEDSRHLPNGQISINGMEIAEPVGEVWNLGSRFIWINSKTNKVSKI